MGKWVEVECNCVNRIRLPGSDYDFDRPHRHKHHLTKKQEEEVEEWKRTTKDMFQCGHRNGVVIDFWPGDIILLGNLIGSVFRDQSDRFEVFVKVGDWRCYEDELLLIQPDEAALWLIEVGELQQALKGSGTLPQGKIEKLIVEFFHEDLSSTSDLLRRIDEAADRMPFATVVSLKRNVQQSGQPDLESTVQKIIEALKNAADLCDISIQTHNPIRMLW